MHINRSTAQDRNKTELLFPVPDLFQKIGHIDFLALHVHDPRMFQHPPWSSSSRRFFFQTEVDLLVTVIWTRAEEENSPAINKVLEIIRPANPMIRLIFQLRDRLADDVSKKIDQTGARLHFSPVGREWESMLGDLEQRHSKGPDIGGDSVRLACDSLRCHVIRCSNEGVGIALGAEFAADAKVAEFHLTVTTQ